MKCTWTEPEDTGAAYRLRCQVCERTTVILKSGLQRVYHGDLQLWLDAQLDCGQHPAGVPFVKADRQALAVAEFPGLAKRAGKWTSAVARWVALGRPTRPPDEVARLFETCCLSCPHYLADKRSCNLCGCKVRNSGAAFQNKLSLGTEACPDKPPRWVEMPGFEQVKQPEQ